MAPFTRFYKPVHFSIQEFIDPDTFAAHGESSWRFLDPLLLMTMDRIRARYGRRITINNWNSAGPYRYRGFRPPDCTEGAKLSSHRRGTACDFDVEGMTAEQVRADIKANIENFDFNMITVVEEALAGKPISWVHISVENMPTRINWLHV